MDINMKYLIVVDMQKDFITGSLGTKEAQTILPKVIDKVQHYDGQILFTKDTHTEDYLNTQEGKKLPVKHCILGEDGWYARRRAGGSGPKRRLESLSETGLWRRRACGSAKEENEKKQSKRLNCAGYVRISASSPMPSC